MDDLTKKGAAHLSKINTQEAWQVDYWTKELDAITRPTTAIC
jgi:Protein of unknown function (DUF3606)